LNAFSRGCRGHLVVPRPTMPGRGPAAYQLRNWRNASALLPGWRARTSNNTLRYTNLMAAQMLRGADPQTRAFAAANMIGNSMLDYRVRAHRAVRRRAFGHAHTGVWTPAANANFVLGPVAARLRARLAAIRSRRSGLSSPAALLEHRLTGRNRYFTRGPSYRRPRR